MNKKNVLIFGAGSIGNHMANACLKLKFNVFVTDISTKALTRMKEEIFIKRYGKWNNSIRLIEYDRVFQLKEKFKLIIIGTPPKTHYQLFKNCKKKLVYENILIEKPLCSFKQNFFISSKDLKNTNLFCGYNHSVSPSINYLFKKIEKVSPDQLEFIDIQWREGWRGIMNAHFWLKNERDTYLGNYKDGGGAIQEHSHGLHLSVCLMSKFFNDKYKIENKRVLFSKKVKNKVYDKYSSIIFYHKEKKLNLELDLFSLYPRKEINIYLKNNKSISWIHNYKKNNDLVRINLGKKEKNFFFKKNRSTEFVNEIKHICQIDSKQRYNSSRIRVSNAIKCMKIIESFF